METKDAFETLVLTLSSRKPDPSDNVEERLQYILQCLNELRIYFDTPVGNSFASNVNAKIINIVTAAKTCDGNDILLANWLIQLITTNRLLRLDDQQLERLLTWLLASVQHENNPDPSRTLRCMTEVLHAHQSQAAKYWEQLFHPNCSKLLQRWLLHIDLECKETVIVLVVCLDTLIVSLVEQPQLSESQTEICHLVANALLHQHYGGAWVASSGHLEPNRWPILLLHSLQLLQKICTLCPDFPKKRTSELFGMVKAFIKYGTNRFTNVTVPQRVSVSQQALYDSSSDADIDDSGAKARNTGGKIWKIRKPRAVIKGKRQQQLETSNTDQPNGNASKILQLQYKDIGIKTSDSEMSDNNDGSTKAMLNESQLLAKVRLAAINLFGSVARGLERRVLYGYWHVIFPIDDNFTEARDDILYIGYRDSNIRCRIAALQVAAQLLFGSKQFLSQAETDKRPGTSAFLPFGVSLGLSVMSSYQTLNVILASEASLPVLVQALKCLAVLIQATPFEQLQDGFVKQFVPFVKAFINQHDCTIQVSALMVMEFLLARPALTDEIAITVGLPPNASLRAQQLEEQEDEIETECAEFDEEQIVNTTTEQEKNAILENSNTLPHCSWLLNCVLNNIDYNTDSCVRSPPTPVRVESLQVLMTMAAHFSLLRDHTERVAMALQRALSDPLTDVRLYAGRCLDAIAYQMSRHIAENKADERIRDFSVFWTRMLPIIYATYMHDLQLELPALKVCLCDALSNIGATLFERLSHTDRTCMLAFLSGSSSEESEDVYVRAAAVRALAVYVLYPTLRGDLVYVENTAESTLRLVKNPNLGVRIKAIWSLGNISDALVSKTPATIGNRTRVERISDDLLRRMINAATKACNDNDKVRSNAVRSLGNLLRLLNESQLNDSSWRQLADYAINKLVDSICASGNAKVKWNTCYAIGSLMKNHVLFESVSLHDDIRWPQALFAALCHAISSHSNFKVRINATAAILSIEQRSYFNTYFETIWKTLLAAIVQSHNLDNFYEYNHRDSLQEQLCFAVAHMLDCAKREDMPTLRRHLTARVEVVRSTWMRVINRIVADKAAPLVNCVVHLQEWLRYDGNEHQQQQHLRQQEHSQQTATSLPLNAEQRSALTFIADALTIQ